MTSARLTLRAAAVNAGHIVNVCRDRINPKFRWLENIQDRDRFSGVFWEARNQVADALDRLDALAVQAGLVPQHHLSARELRRGTDIERQKVVLEES